MLSTLALTLPLLGLQEPAIDAPALFHEHCASCHGEAGDGKGWAELDRQARSFKDGGFSFGNTPETILRTVTNGIPGSPMPAFDRALTEEQREALVEHVIALGPPDMSTVPTNTEMVVTDRPLIVRGGLPPIADGLDARPRGLLLGTLAGLTYEYRTDDVRLLGVRSGAFCDRTDWVGRGGTPLNPMGQVVHLHEGGDPGPAFELLGAGGARRPLRAKLRATWVRESIPGITYALLTDEGQPVAEVDESVTSLTSRPGTAFCRRFELRSVGAAATLVAHTIDLPRADDDQVHSTLLGGRILGPAWSRLNAPVDMHVEAVGTGRRVLIHSRPRHLGSDGEGALRRLTFELAPGAPVRFQEAWLHVPEWSEELRQQLVDDLIGEAGR